MKKLPWHIEELLLSRRRIKGGCWNYTGSLSNGYGQIGINNRSVPVHRVAWQLWVGEIPKGHHVHHVCGNPACFNPEHLEVKLPGDHTRFHNDKKLCVRGHDLNDPSNIYTNRPPGIRQCKLCARIRYHEKRNK